MPQKFNPSNIKLVVGLGNEGSGYKDTYHNVGWQALDYLAACAHTSFKKASRKRFEYCAIPTRNIWLVKPLPLMNISGNGVREAFSYLDIPDTHSIMVVHDDADIELGAHKLHYNRGAAGHRGISSIIEALHTQAFWRFRIGIRKPPIDHQPVRHRAKASEIVLQRIPTSDVRVLRAAFGTLARFLEVET